MKTRKSTLCLIPLLLAGILGCGQGPYQPEQHQQEEPRPNFIVGGSPARSDDLQAVVALKIGERESLCTGTLNSHTEISSAAHCFFPGTDIESIRKEMSAIIREKEQALLDQGKEDQEEIKALILGFLADLMEEKAVNTKIYFTGEEDFQSGMVKETKGHERWAQYFVDEYFETNRSSFLTYLQEKVSSLSQSSRLDKKKYDDLDVRDRITLILHHPIDIPAIPWIKETEWDLATTSEDIFQVGFGLQFDPLFLEWENFSVIEKMITFNDTRNDFSEKQPNRQWEKYLEWKNSSYIADDNPRKMRTSPLEIYEITGKKIFLSTHDSTLSGGCNGDSGGPILMRLKTGELRQIAVMNSALVFCGAYTVGIMDTVAPDHFENN